MVVSLILSLLNLTCWMPYCPWRRRNQITWERLSNALFWIQSYFCGKSIFCNWILLWNVFKVWASQTLSSLQLFKPLKTAVLKMFTYSKNIGLKWILTWGHALCDIILIHTMFFVSGIGFLSKKLSGEFIPIPHCQCCPRDTVNYPNKKYVCQHLFPAV